MKQIKDIWFPDEDTHFERMMNDDGTYQYDTFLVCMKHMKEPKIFYDIGAHVGLWSLMAIKAGFKEINAYEPNPRTFECLENNLIDKDGVYKAYLNNYGVGEVAARLKLISNDKSNSGAVSLQTTINMPANHPDSVVVNNIDNSIEIQNQIVNFQLRPHETLVKIDTEGSEIGCVLGMDKIIYALRPIVCVEQRSNDDALKTLQKMGMKIVQQVRKDYILIWKDQ